MNQTTRWKLRCPLCGDQQHVHYSWMRWYELPWLLFGRRAYRCYWCGERFVDRAVQGSRPPRLDRTSGGARGMHAQCPNCAKSVALTITPEEERQARELGWYVSCPACRVAFVYHAK